MNAHNSNINQTNPIKNSLTPISPNLNNSLLLQDPNNNQNTNLNIPNNSDGTNVNNLSNLIELINNIQAVQLLNSFATAGNQNFNQAYLDSKNQQGINHNQTSSNQVILSNQLTTQNQNVNNQQNQNQNVSSGSKSSNFLNTLYKYDDKFKQFLDFKKNATNIVYVEGLPLNSTEREVAHMFRPFPGFKSLRLITKEKSLINL